MQKFLTLVIVQAFLLFAALVRSLSQFLQNQALLSNLCSFCSTMK
ncbi:hypothetical protein [Nostoc edaphicum]|nr:hypothetical protein [Nostoc edaphicum]